MIRYKTTNNSFKETIILSIGLLACLNALAQCTINVSGNVGAAAYGAGDYVCLVGDITAGTMTVDNGAVVDFNGYSNAGSMTIGNNGTAYMSGQNNGSITVNPGGNLQVCGNLSTSATISVSGSGTLTLSAGSTLDLQASSLSINGPNQILYVGDPTCKAYIKLSGGTFHIGLASPNQVTTASQMWFGTGTTYGDVGVEGAGNKGDPVGALCGSIQGCGVSACPTPTVAGSISSSATVCSGTNSGTLTLSGHTGNILKWQKSENGGAWADIANTTTTENYNNLTATTTEYRAVLHNTGSCDTLTSATSTITTDAVSVGGTIASAATVCEGDNSATLTLSGHTGSITKWQKNVNGGGWTDIANTTTTEVYTNITQSTDYRAVVTNGTCAAINSATVSLTVTPTLAAGSISADQSICYNTAPAAFSNTVSPTGGTGAYSYQWQTSTTSAVAGFSNVAGTAATYTHATTLTTTPTWFRREVTSGGCVENTTAVEITVYADLTAGTIGSAQTIIIGAIPSELTVAVAPTGGTGSYTYQWESSSDNASWANASGTSTNSSYSPGALSTDMWYRRVVTSGSCGSETSAAIKITVAMSICSGSSPGVISNSTVASGGPGGAPDYQWQSSTDGVSFSDIGGATSEDYTPGNLSQDTWFRRGVTIGGCGPEYTNALKAAVGGDSPGNISSGLLVWLKADAGTGSIGTQWDDQSGNNLHYTTVTGPTLSTGDSSSNFNPYVDIASGGFNAPAGAELGTDYTIVMVAKKQATDDNGRIFDGHSGDYAWGYWGQYSNSLNTNGSPAKHNTSPAVTGQDHKKLQIFTRSSSGELKHYVDGQLIATYGSSNSASGVRVDINAGANFASEESDSRIYEFIIYNEVIPEADRQVIESYLMTKYRLGSNVNYLSSINATTYDVSTYDNDIIGIGKECYFHQKQSQSQDDSIKVFISALAATNDANAGAITNDVSYLILGHDNGKSTATTASNIESPATIDDRLEREWKITNTNFSDDYTLEIEVDNFGPDLTKVRLLVDDDGDFTDADIYGTDEGLTFTSGSIIVGGIGPSIFGIGTTKFFTLGVMAVILPVELVSFQAVKQNDGVEIEWMTSSQRNNDHFILQRSPNGNTEWTEIDRVQGESFSNSLMTYNVQDHHLCRTCFYRLVQVDYNGTEHVSKVVSITNEFANEIEVHPYPNPADGSISLDVFTNMEEAYDVTVYCIEGVKMLQANGDLDVGHNTIEIHVEDLPSGVYFLEFRSSNVAATIGRIFTKN